MEHALGIDVSRWQGAIDWASVAKAGYRFAVIRATIGDDYIDPRFVENWSGARDTGLLLSAYHVIRPDIAAKAQIDHFFGVLGERMADLSLVVDVERDDGETREGITACVKACLDEIELRAGRTPLIYTARWFWDRFVLSSVTWQRYDLWVASYTSRPVLPRDWDHWRFWQYSDRGRVPGVSSRATDLNRFSGDAQDLLHYAGPQVAARPPSLGVQARVIIPKLNVRSGPGLSYDDLGDLREDDVVDMLALTGDDVWIKIAPGKWAAFALDGEQYMVLQTPPDAPSIDDDAE